MDSSALAYAMLTTSYNKIRTICDRYNVSMTAEEAFAKPTGFTFQRDEFPTPGLEEITGYGVIAETNARMANGLSNIIEEDPAGEEQALSIARSLLHTTDLPAPQEQEGDKFRDFPDPDEKAIAEVRESTRISTNEQILMANSDLVASLQKNPVLLDKPEVLVSSNPDVFSQYASIKGRDSPDAVHIGSPQRGAQIELPGARLSTPARVPVDGA